MKILDFLFNRNKGSDKQYELVEYQLDDKTFRQGIRLLNSKYDGVIVTIDPMVKLDPQEDQLKLSFGFTVEANPNSIEIDKDELHPIIGNIIVELIENDYK